LSPDNNKNDKRVGGLDTLLSLFLLLGSKGGHPILFGCGHLYNLTRDIMAYETVEDKTILCDMAWTDYLDKKMSINEYIERINEILEA
jgi:hypothetical protein